MEELLDDVLLDELLLDELELLEDELLLELDEELLELLLELDEEELLLEEPPVRRPSGASNQGLSQSPDGARSVVVQGPAIEAVGRSMDEVSSLFPNDQFIQLTPFWFIKFIHCSARG